MIRGILYDKINAKLVQGGAELIAQWHTGTEQVLWLDIEGEDRNVERPLLEEFGIHPLAIQDALRARHPPKIETFDDCLFILLRGLDANTTGIEFGVIQLSLFVGSNFFVTRHDKPSVSANGLFDAVVDEPQLMAAGPSALAVQVSGRLTRRYVEILLGLEPRLDAIEDEMFDKPNDALLAELTGYKSRLRHLARIARYHKIVVTELQRPNAFVDQQLEHEIVDVHDQIERAQSLADLYYEVAADLTDGYLALSSHRLNRVMQILTVITVIFVPLTFLAGIYGMNFENMPELGSRVGYFIVLGVMFVSAVIQLIIFRRKGWV